MLSKPFTLLLVYILILCNFLLLTIPFLLAIFPFIKIYGENVVLLNRISFNPKIAVFSIIFVISFLMMIYLFLDFIFGFSARSLLKNCKRFDKVKGYEFLDEIFEQLKFKFSCPNLKLYIEDSDEINAYAIGSMGRKNIVLTTGLLHHYLNNIPDNEKFLIAIRSILAHEMSHLINKDFLPGLLILINKKVTNLVAEILLVFFTIYLQIATKLKFQSNWISLAMLKIYHISHGILSFFSRFVIYNLYEFLKRFFSREIEFRSDRQSAKAFGGINMAFSLSLLGNSGYFTLFSTHPSTKKRIRKVEVVEEKNAIIRPSLLSNLSNFVSIMILPMICLYAAHMSKIDLLIQYYIFHYHYDFYSDAVMFFNKAEFFIKSFIKNRW